VVAGGETQCTVALTETAEAGSTVRLAADNPLLSIPEAVEVQPGRASAQFTLRSQPSDLDAESLIVAAIDESAALATLEVRGLKPAALSCLPKSLRPGEKATCELRLNASEVGEAVRLDVQASGTGLKVPAFVTTRPRQATLTFQVQAERTCGDDMVTVGVRFGANTVEDTLATASAAAPVLTLPGERFAKFGARLGFHAAVSDPSGLPVELSVSDLPHGASFDSQTGSFEWIPEEAQLGRYEIVFTARNSANVSATGRVVVNVDAGKPVITDLLNGASQSNDAVCSPGSRATIVGRWLSLQDEPRFASEQPVTDLGGTRVNVNGAYVPVLYASPLRVDFACPVLDAGVPLEVSVENEAGATEPAAAVMQDASPGLFALDGSGKGQGLVFHAGSSSLVASRDFTMAGLPAQAGDRVVLRATGLAHAVAASITIGVGDVWLPAEDLAEVSGELGVYHLTVMIPAGVAGEAVPLSLRGTAPDGRLIESNTITIAIEGERP
jgi:uncharacterized protein (TIGR03437 family)